MFTNTELNFHLRTQIGVGGQAEVWLADDPQLNAEIVIKKIPKSSFVDLNKYFEECRKLYLTRHHNVVCVRYGCQDASSIYLAMPYYSMGSLKQLIDTRFLTLREIIRYSLQFLSGLNNIHSKRLLHYDVKPENILLDDSNKALISDFGLAEYMGTYGFAIISGTTQALAPPELFSQAAHNFKFDIYQAGLTLYRLCNGDGEFSSQFQNAFVSRGVQDQANFVKNLCRESFPDRSRFLPHISKSFRKIIKTAIKANPNDRYNSVLDILNDISKIDNANDWHYSKLANVESWKMPNYLVTCTYVASNNTYEIVALKNGRRNNRYCTTQNTQADAHSSLYNCLNNGW